MGRFKLIPLKGSAYSVNLITSDFRDSIFKLPELLLESPTISIAKSLANDTLKIRITDKYPENVTVLVHNYRQIFYVSPVKANAIGKTVLIDLKILPKGLATITVLDSAQRPCAERLFFAHYNKRSSIEIQTDKSQYAKREKVKLTLKFKTIDTGLVSVACVQSNRMQIRNSNDIESYVYLKHELDNLPLKEKYMGDGTEDKTYLENILLIKGWRRYNWQEMLQTTETDTASKPSLLILSGKVTRLGSPLKKPVRLVIMTDSATSTVQTDRTGAVTLNNYAILTDQNKKVHFLVINGNVNDYEIKINDPFIKVTQSAIPALHSKPDLFYSSNTDSLALKGSEHAITLKEVKIKAATDNSIYGSAYGLGRNVCGDYVCIFHILNCVNHSNDSGNKPPIEGETYIVQNGNVFEKVTYRGCTVPIFHPLLALDGIKYSKEFYGSDYSVISPSPPEYYSTIFWKHLVPVNSSNEVQLNFYTSDISGPFKVIVQGITRNDVVYQEKEFMVK